MRFVEYCGEVTPSILHFKMKNQAAMIDAFLRIQERAESTNEEFRKRPFTVGEFRSWYASTASPVFDYPHAVYGVNFPDSAVKPFLDGLFDPLTEGEREIVELLRGKRGSFYIIGTYGDANNALEHEICHGLYYTDAAYRKAVNATLDGMDKRTKKKALTALADGYHKSVLVDELHAYMATGWSEFFGADFPMPKDVVAKLKRIKERAFERHDIDLEAVSQGRY
jgi:hypothetical protein